MDSRTYSVGSSTIKVIFGNIVESRAEVIVSSDDTWISAGGGVSYAINDAGGPLIQMDAVKLRNRPLGDVVVTTGGYLDAKYVFHAITLDGKHKDVDRSLIVRQATHKAMELLPALGCSSIAFPAIGAGAARIPYATVATEMAGTLIEVLADSPMSFDVELYLWDRKGRVTHENFYQMLEAFAQATYAVELDRDGLDGFNEPDIPEHPVGRHPQVAEMVRQLDGRRRDLEASVLAHLNAPDPNSATELRVLREHLAEISALRDQYMVELTRTPGTDPRGGVNSVFVSSTSQDLLTHRAAVRKVIEEMKLTYIGMEDFTPESTRPAEMIRRRVAESSTYVGILGMRYGFVDDGTGLSMTELEYQQAIASCKPILMFVMDDHAPITPAMVEKDPESFVKLDRFRKTVMTQHSCNLFRTEQDLADRVERALRG